MKNKTENWDVEDLAKKIHSWCLEAVKELDPDDFNEKAVKTYGELTEGQKFIDRYIAREIINLLQFTRKETIESVLQIIDDYFKGLICMPSPQPSKENLKKEIKKLYNPPQRAE